MTERYSSFTLKIRALSNLTVTATHTDAEVWDVDGLQEMNGVGGGSFRMYASNASLLSDIEGNVGQVVTVYVTDQAAGGVKRDLATFVIEKIEYQPEEGISVVSVSGPGILDQLRNQGARDDAIDNGSGGRSTTDISDIMGYAASGWSLSNASATTAGSYHAARGDTVLALLQAAADQTGEIFRLETYVDPSSKELHWRASPDSSGITLRMPTTYDDYEGSTTVGRLFTFRKEVDFEPVITEVRPFGAGVGDGRLDITGISSSDTGADPAWLDTTFASNLMTNTTLEASLGYGKDMDKDFSHIQANDPTDATQLTTAAVALWNTCKIFLEKHNASREFFTAECDIAANIRPGQTVTIVYPEYQGGTSGGTQTIDINDSLTVLSVRNRFIDGELVTTLSLGDVALPKPTAESFVASVAEKTQFTTRKSSVQTSPGSVSTSRRVNTTNPVKISGGNSADLSADRTIALAGISGFGTGNQVIGANAGGTTLQYKSVVAGSNATVTHTSGQIQISAAVGTGDLHDALTLDIDAEAFLSLNGQELGLDTKAANIVFAGPTSGGANEPTFRALVFADIPSSSSPGAAASVLATDSAGALQVLRLGIGAAPGTDNAIKMADDGWIGLSSGAARVVFDNQTPDEVRVEDADFFAVNDAAIGHNAFVATSGHSGRIVEIRGSSPLLSIIDSDDDDRPVFQLEGSGGHDSLSFMWDAYYNGANNVSSDVGSNYRLAKTNDIFTIDYNAGTTAGNTISSFTTGLALRKTGEVLVGKTFLEDDGGARAELTVTTGNAFGHVFQASERTSGSIGAYSFVGRNSTAEDVQYSRVIGGITSSTNGSESGELLLQTKRSGSIGTVVTIRDGVQVGSPTGGDKGAGTINAEAVYDDNVLLSDRVFEDDYQMMTIPQVKTFYTQNKRLPTIDGRAHWEQYGRPPLGKLLTQIWETVECNAVHTVEVYEQVERVEAQAALNSDTLTAIDNRLAEVERVLGGLNLLGL